MLNLWRHTDQASFAQAWLARAHPIGTKLSVHLGKDEAVSGRFGGLDPDGALRLMRDDGSIDLIRAADVEL